jgi:GNAT superfamily N-acetyltransferase
MSAPFTVRLLNKTDSLNELTELLHRAYAALDEMGLNYTAVDQSVEQTAERIAAGICTVANVGNQLVGTITAVDSQPDGGCPWYQEPYVATADQFAVEPAFQGTGIGSALITWAETWAQQQHYTELAVDTAETADHLVAMYKRRGYQFIDFVQWPGKRYRSLVLSKTLPLRPNLGR